MSAAVVYATTIREERPELAAEAAELADLFCKQARRRVGDLFGALWSNEDVENYALAQRVLEGRYAFLEEASPTPPATDRSSHLPRSRPGRPLASRACAPCSWPSWPSPSRPPPRPPCPSSA